MKTRAVERTGEWTGRQSVRVCFFFSSGRRHTRYWRDWSSDVCSADLLIELGVALRACAEIAVRLQAAIASPARDQVYWVERAPAGDRSSLRAAPLHVGGVLQDRKSVV